MSEHLQDGFFREIDDELRQEHYAKLWKKYGNYIIVLALALIVGIGGYQAWHRYDLSKRRTYGESYFNAMRLVRENHPKKAAKAFSEIAKNADSGYAMLADFQRAAVLVKSGEKDKAAAVYRQLADDSSVATIYRDLAQMLGVIVEIDSKDQKSLILRLAPLDTEANPWRHSAREIMALLAERAGEHDKAVKLVKGIKNDATTPQSMRQRAEELLNAFGRK